MQDAVITQKQKDILAKEIQKGLDDIKFGRISNALTFINMLIAKYESNET